ncbi:unnamed protein product [Fasciola hepatica]|uniref:Uncharacterized protein n=1 Tax=Fasciola hepatica TaxID=6192 RepID=A0ABC9HF40_FASHE|nr:unnamed protein product [Fasciola hepatica]
MRQFPIGQVWCRSERLWGSFIHNQSDRLVETCTFQVIYVCTPSVYHLVSAQSLLIQLALANMPSKGLMLKQNTAQHDSSVILPMHAIDWHSGRS